MSGFGSVLKNGWHPEKSGQSLIPGRGKKESLTSREKALNHQSTPLATLKDPDSFAPPPKHINYHGAEAAAASNTRSPIAASTGGLGAPIPQSHIETRQQEVRRAQEEAEQSKPPSGPYRVNHTGLDASHLPPPPKFLGQGGAAPRAPTRVPTVSTTAPAAAATTSKPKPSLPPRLPPRQNSNPTEHTGPPPPTYNDAVSTNNKSYVNQDAMNRLGKAGVNVPGFSIGSGPTSTTATAPVSPPVNELQSRFAKMATPSAGSPSEGTTFAQKQQAMRTANAFKNDPSSISIADARNAASTANNFRERHGEQAASGWKSAQNINQKYGVVNKVNGLAADNAAASTAGRKAPPPPPKKKELSTEASVAPPPIPLSSKPRPA